MSEPKPPEPGKERERWLTLILQSIPDGIIIVDRKRQITGFNHAAERLTGYSREEALGKTCSDILHRRLNIHECPLLEAMVARQVVTKEAVLENRQGEKIAVLLSAAALRDEDGSLAGGVEVFRDITLRKRMEEERRFLVDMFAHDLKAPVVGIAGLIQRLRQGKLGRLTGEQLSYLDTVEREMRGMEKLIEDFLRFSRLDLRILTPQTSAIEVEKECQEIITLLSPLAEARGMTLKAEFPEEVLLARADPVLFRRVVENLIDNAIKYSPDGTTITLKAHRGDPEVLLSVKDQGYGIPKEAWPRLFEVGYRGQGAANRKGFGLGLPTVKRIVEAHGGQVWVESEEGRGSTFFFTFPRSPAS